MDLTAAANAMQAGRLAAEAAGIELPPPWLPEWNGLCAGEYALAVLRLRIALIEAGAALGGAALLLAAS